MKRIENIGKTSRHLSFSFERKTLEFISSSLYITSRSLYITSKFVYSLWIDHLVEPIVRVQINWRPRPEGDHLLVGGQLDRALDVIVDNHGHVVEEKARYEEAARDEQQGQASRIRPAGHLVSRVQVFLREETVFE